MRDDAEDRRRAMVVGQLRARGVRDDRVLEAMGRVPRELFVPADQQPAAYADGALRIGHGQTISQPFIVALMTESLHLAGTEKVLEVGTGSGYQTAILHELAGRVCTVERVPELSQRAQEVLCGEMGRCDIEFRVGDGTLGWPEEAPFDRIIVTAGAPRRPEALLDQLACGGEAIAPVGGRYSQTMMHYTRDAEGELHERPLGECVFVQLIGEDGW